MSKSDTQKTPPPAPPLADLVNAGMAQSEAVAITDFIFMSRDVSNAYLVTTNDGDVLVNAGTAPAAGRARALFAPHRRGDLRKIILTQSHYDHFGGVDGLREAGTEVIVHRLYPETRDYYVRLAPFFRPRTNKLWASVLAGQGGRPQVDPEITPDLLFDDGHAFELGGRRFELLWTPEGETVDSLCVWLPDDRVVFTGNLFGPVFLSMPFLNTLRGDRPRRVVQYLKSLDRVRQLGAELLITGHGEPVRGAAQVRADLDRMYAAVSYVNEATMAGMNAGKDCETLMREIRVPDEIAIGEFHGKVAWAVKSIWYEHTGWFHYQSTTELYGVPRGSVDADIVEMAGGADALAARAGLRCARGEPLEAIHLLDIALGAEPANRAALMVKLRALAILLERSGGSNLSETMWLKSEIAEAEARLTSG